MSPKRNNSAEANHVVNVVLREESARDAFGAHDAVQVGARELRARRTPAAIVDRAPVARHIRFAHVQLTRVAQRVPAPLLRRMNSVYCTYWSTLQSARVLKYTKLTIQYISLDTKLGQKAGGRRQDRGHTAVRVGYTQSNMSQPSATQSTRSSA